MFSKKSKNPTKNRISNEISNISNLNLDQKNHKVEQNTRNLIDKIDNLEEKRNLQNLEHSENNPQKNSKENILTQNLQEIENNDKNLKSDSKTDSKFVSKLDSKSNSKTTSKSNSKLTNFWLGYNVFLWLGLLVFNLTFSVNWLQAIFYLATSGLLALLLGNVILRRFSTKALQISILVVFIFANIILTFFKQFELFWSLYYLTYCLIFVRLFISLRNRIGERKFWHQITKRSLRILTSIFLLLTLPFSYFFITDPFNSTNTILRPYESYQQNGQIGLTKLEKLRAFRNPFSTAIGYLKAGGHIFGANFVKEKGFETMNSPTNSSSNSSQISQNEIPLLRGGNGVDGVFSTSSSANSQNSVQNTSYNQVELDQIIKQTHDLRFGPNIPYIISGGHFSVFYARSLGIFYHPTMDPNLNSSQNDWQNRQIAYLKTLAFAMDSFESCGDLYTTVVPLGENSVTCINIYHYPSDTLYSLLFAFSQLLDNSEYLQTFYPSPNSQISNSQNFTKNAQNISNNIPNSTDSTQNFTNSETQQIQNSNSVSSISSSTSDLISNSLTSNSDLTNQKTNNSNDFKASTKRNFDNQTQTYTKVLLNKYRQTLIKFWQKYKNLVFDDATGLIKKDIELSGTKDIGLQNGSFYDNVIFWKTWKLAQNLDLTDKDESGLENLKSRIIGEFWNEDLGIFAEDQSVECAKKCYSSDWLVILSTGFLNIGNSDERKYYQKSIDFIIANKVDQPFPLRYHNDDRPDKTYPLVRLTNHEYAGTAIWSFWGTEYIKTLYLLSQFQNEKSPKIVENQTKTENQNPNPEQNSQNNSQNSANSSQVLQINSQNNSTNSQESKNSELPQNSQISNNYRQIADQFLEKYAQNIVKYGGFAEVYDSRGKMMEANLYRSVVKTGWIVNWEQARAMRDWLDKTEK